MSLDIGDKAPDFSLPAAGGGTAALADYAGKTLVLYFYPRANTSGCTKQSVGFSELKDEFEAAGAHILGVSKDPVKDLDKFVSKQNLAIALASDEQSNLCEAFGVWKEKSMYGKTYMGIERSTFVIAPGGTISHAWRKVKVPGHVDAVLAAIREA